MPTKKPDPKAAKVMKPMPRQRRPTAEIRSLILDSACSLFVERGFEHTSTREIAQRAGIAEPLIFRNFGSKEQLFEQAVFVPFSAFVDDWVRHWENADYAHLSMHELSQEYVRSLYGLLRRSRGLIKELMVVGFRSNWRFIHTDSPDSPFGRLFMQLTAMGENQIATHRMRAGNPRILLYLTFSLIMSAAIMDEWAFPKKKTRPSEKEMIEELTEFLVNALAPTVWDPVNQPVGKPQGKKSK